MTDKEKQEGKPPMRIELLEQCVARIAHMTGTESVLREYGIPKWNPGKEHMTRVNSKV